MVPVIEDGELERLVLMKYGSDAMGSQEFMANVLFDDQYSNDSCKSYYFKKDEVYEGKSWQNEERIRISNYVNSILREAFPSHDHVLIDVSW